MFPPMSRRILSSASLAAAAILVTEAMIKPLPLDELLPLACTCMNCAQGADDDDVLTLVHFPKI